MISTIFKGVIRRAAWRQFLLSLTLSCVMPVMAQAGKIEFEFEGRDLKRFDARGVTYAELHKLVAAFAGVEDELLASPPQMMQLTLENTTWGELMLKLYNPKLFSVERSEGNKLIVIRKRK